MLDTNTLLYYVYNNYPEIYSSIIVKSKNNQNINELIICEIINYLNDIYKKAKNNRYFGWNNDINIENIAKKISNLNIIENNIINYTLDTNFNISVCIYNFYASLNPNDLQFQKTIKEILDNIIYFIGEDRSMTINNQIYIFRSNQSTFFNLLTVAFRFIL